MKHYINKNKELFGIESGQEFLIQPYWVEVSLEEIKAINKAKEEKAFNSLSYAEKRASEYPNVLDYIDGIVKGDEVQVQEYIDKCLAVKAKYPKQK